LAKILATSLGNRLVNLFGPEPAAWVVLKIDEARQSAVREAQFIAAAARDSLVLDQSDSRNSTTAAVLAAFGTHGVLLTRWGVERASNLTPHLPEELLGIIGRRSLAL
jgi:hypothetical protein